MFRWTLLSSTFDQWGSGAVNDCSAVPRDHLQMWSQINCQNHRYSLGGWFGRRGQFSVQYFLLYFAFSYSGELPCWTNHAFLWQVNPPFNVSHQNSQGWHRMAIESHLRPLTWESHIVSGLYPGQARGGSWIHALLGIFDFPTRFRGTAFFGMTFSSRVDTTYRSHRELTDLGCRRKCMH